MRAWCYGYVYGFNSTGKLSYKSIRIVRLLGVMSKQTKSFCLVAQHQQVYKIENLRTVLETILISIMLEVLCYQDTLTMNLLMSWRANFVNVSLYSNT